MEQSIFHEAWWLAAVTSGDYKEAVVERGGNTVGRLPYFVTKRGPFTVARMPPFTHMLGPLVDPGEGKLQTQMAHRLSITRELIDQLPQLDYFEQQFDPGLHVDLTATYGLAFQDRGFRVMPQYTFRVDCRQSSEALWDGMQSATRQQIRRAEKKYSVATIDEAKPLIDLYLANTESLGRTNTQDFDVYPALFAACRERQCGEIVAAVDANGTPVSMIFLVWSATTMYYVLSTRGAGGNDGGSVSQLLWEGMKRANARGLTFDFDGVYSSGQARFLVGFGGQIHTRLAVRRGRFLFSACQYLKLAMSNNQSRFFT